MDEKTMTYKLINLHDQFSLRQLCENLANDQNNETEIIFEGCIFGTFETINFSADRLYFIKRHPGSQLPLLLASTYQEDYPIIRIKFDVKMGTNIESINAFNFIDKFQYQELFHEIKKLLNRYNLKVPKYLASRNYGFEIFKKDQWVTMTENEGNTEYFPWENYADKKYTCKIFLLVEETVKRDPDAKLTWGPCYPDQRTIAQHLFFRSLILLFPDTINTNKLPNINDLKHRLLKEYEDGFDYLIFTHKSISIRTQTAKRIAEFGLADSKLSMDRGTDIRDQLVWTWHSRFHEGVLDEKDNGKFYRPFIKKVRANRKTLYIVVNDECHWGIGKKKLHDQLINELYKESNVFVLQVSATPYNIITSNSRIPEIYRQEKGTPYMVEVTHRDTINQKANMVDWKTIFKGYPSNSDSDSFDLKTKQFFDKFGFDELCFINWKSVLAQTTANACWPLPMDVSELPRYEGDIESHKEGIEYRSLSRLKKDGCFKGDQKFHERLKGIESQADVVLLAEYLRTLAILSAQQDAFKQVREHLERIDDFNIAILRKHFDKSIEEKEKSKTDEIMEYIVNNNQMVVVRIISKIIGNLWIKVLSKIRVELKLEEQFDVIGDFGDFSNKFLIDRMNPPFSEKFINKSVKDKKIMTYDSLVDVPCILVLVEKGRLGDSFPQSLYCLDFRARNVIGSGKDGATNNSLTAITQELGRLCQYRNPKEPNKPYALLGKGLMTLMKIDDPVEMELDQYFDNPSMNVNEYMRRRGVLNYKALRKNYRKNFPDDSRPIPSWVFRELFEPQPTNYDYKNKEKDYKRLVLCAEPQIGKTGAYLRYLRYFFDIFKMEKSSKKTIFKEFEIWEKSVDLETFNPLDWIFPKEKFTRNSRVRLTNLKNGKYSKKLETLRLRALLHSSKTKPENWRESYKRIICSKFHPENNPFGEGIFYQNLIKTLNELPSSPNPVRVFDDDTFAIQSDKSLLDTFLNWDGVLTKYFQSRDSCYRKLDDKFRISASIQSYGDVYSCREEEYGDESNFDTLKFCEDEEQEITGKRIMIKNLIHNDNYEMRNIANTAGNSNSGTLTEEDFMDELFRDKNDEKCKIKIYATKEGKENFKQRDRNIVWIFMPTIGATEKGYFDYDLEKENLSYVQVLVIREKELDKHKYLANSNRLLMILPHKINMKFMNKKYKPDWNDNHSNDYEFFAEQHSIGYARLFIQLVAFFLGLEFVWMIDDNVSETRELNLDKMKANKGHSNNSAPNLCTPGKIIRSLEAIVGRQEYSDEDKKYLLENQSYSLDSKDIAVLGIHRQWQMFNQIKFPFLQTLSIYSFFLLNVKVTVEKKIYFLPKHIHEDVHFLNEAKANGLKIIKCNRFFHAKINFQPRALPETDEFHDGIEVFIKADGRGPFEISGKDDQQQYVLKDKKNGKFLTDHYNGEDLEVRGGSQI